MNKTISELNQVITLATNDILPILDISETDNTLKNKKVSVQQILDLVPTVPASVSEANKSLLYVKTNFQQVVVTTSNNNLIINFSHNILTTFSASTFNGTSFVANQDGIYRVHINLLFNTQGISSFYEAYLNLNGSLRNDGNSAINKLPLDSKYLGGTTSEFVLSGNTVLHMDSTDNFSCSVDIRCPGASASSVAFCQQGRIFIEKLPLAYSFTPTSSGS